MSQASNSAPAAARMRDFIFLMHRCSAADDTLWGPWLAKLEQAGALQGGSAIGNGAAISKLGRAAITTSHLDGYVRVQATDLETAIVMLAGNPVFESVAPSKCVSFREMQMDDLRQGSGPPTMATATAAGFRRPG